MHGFQIAWLLGGCDCLDWISSSCAAQGRCFHGNDVISPPPPCVARVVGEANSNLQSRQNYYYYDGLFGKKFAEGNRPVF